VKKKLWGTVPFRHIGGDPLFFSGHREAHFPEFLTLGPRSWLSSYFASLTVVWRYAQEKQKSPDRNSGCIILRIFLGWRFLLQDNKMPGWNNPLPIGQSTRDIQSPLAIVNDKNRALSVHYSQVFTIPKLTKVVLE